MEHILEHSLEHKKIKKLVKGSTPPFHSLRFASFISLSVTGVGTLRRRRY